MNHLTRYNLTITTITPVHIGSGKELRLGFDFFTDHHYTYRLNIDRLIEAKADQMQPDQRGRYPLPSELLQEHEKKSHAFIRYRLIGTPKSQKRDARLKEAIKDVYDRPYLPGSSLKGAIRTAIAWSVWPEVNPKVSGNRPVGANVEKQIFGTDPNHDLLRALKISDCLTKKTASSAMRVANVNVVSQTGENDIPIEMEVIKADQEFLGTMAIDEYYFSNHQANAQLGYGDKRRWLTNLCQHINAHSQSHIQRLMQWFAKIKGCEAVYDTFQMMHKALQQGLPDGQAVMFVGFGGGWDGITFGSRLQDDPELWQTIVKGWGRQLSRKRIDPKNPTSFPATRRAMRDPLDQRFARPMGWVLLNLERVD